MIDLRWATNMVAGDVMAFYANLDTPSYEVDFDNWVLSIVHADSFVVVYDDFATLTKDDLSSGGFRFYSEFTVPDDIPEGDYRFIIYIPYTDEVKYVSNQLRVINSVAAQNSFLVKYRNSVDIQNFGYEANTSFYNIARLPLRKEQPQREKTNIGYDLVGGGFKRVRTIVGKGYNFITGYLDEDGHDAFDIATIHSDLQLNNDGIYVSHERPEDASYEAETERDFPLSTGTIKLKRTSYNSSNKGV